MLIVAAEVLGLTQAMLAVGFAVFLRVGAAAALLPAFGERSVPVRLRLALALGFTVITAPAVLPVLPDLGPGAPWGRLVATEVIAGLALGAGLRLLVLALSTAGSMAAQATSLAQIFGGAAADPAPVIGHVLVISGLALACMTGLHVRLVELFVLSYQVMPAGTFPRPDDLLDWGLFRVGHAFSLAFGLAAPFVIASLVYNLALGVINRAMPQLMVAFVGAPAITAGALTILALASPLILEVWMAALGAFLADPFGGRP